MTTATERVYPIILDGVLLKARGKTLTGRTLQFAMTQKNKESKKITSIEIELTEPLTSSNVGLVEVKIPWPVRLYGTTPLQMIVTGRITARAGNRVEMHMRTHEFCTLSRDKVVAIA